MRSRERSAPCKAGRRANDPGRHVEVVTMRIHGSPMKISGDNRELGYGGVRNFLSDVVDVHQHLLALLRMTVFGIVFAFLVESSEEMSRFVSHRAVGPAVGDQGDPLFGIGGAIVG